MINRKTDKGDDEVRMFDLQFPRVARPTIDLVYFLYTSTSVEFRQKHLKEMLLYYHECLMKELQGLMGYKNSGAHHHIYSFDELQKDFDNCYPFGFVMAVFHAKVNLRNIAMSISSDLNGITNIDSSGVQL